VQDSGSIFLTSYLKGKTEERKELFELVE